MNEDVEVTGRDCYEMELEEMSNEDLFGSNEWQSLCQDEIDARLAACEAELEEMDGDELFGNTLNDMREARIAHLLAVYDDDCDFFDGENP